MNKLFIPFLFFIFITPCVTLAQWTPVYTDETSSDATNVFYVNGILFLKFESGQTGNKLFRSADEGGAWQDISANFPTGITNSPGRVVSMVGIGNEIIADVPATNSTVYVSTDGGLTFTSRYTFNNINIISLTTDGNILYAVSSVRSIYKSTDNGKSFQEIVINYKDNIFITEFFAIGSNYVLKSNSETIGSSDAGATWALIEPSSTTTLSRIFKAKNIIWGGATLAGTNNDGLFKYNPSSRQWMPVFNNPFSSPVSISSNGNLLLCYFINILDGKRRYYVSANDGSSWTELTQDGMLPNNVISLAKRINEMSSTHYFAVYFANASGKVKTILYRMPLNASSVQDRVSKAAFTLKQNFPNPFKNQTTISWSMRSASAITIKIYDMNGKEVETLVNGKCNPGDYTIVLHADAGYKPGIYLCRMQSGENLITSKLIIQ